MHEAWQLNCFGAVNSRVNAMDMDFNFHQLLMFYLGKQNVVRPKHKRQQLPYAFVYLFILCKLYRSLCLPLSLYIYIHLAYA